MTAWAVAACAGFLLGVLWMDLMFDSEIRSGDDPVDEQALASVAAYYRRATTTSQPRGALIAAVMLALLVLLGTQAVTGHVANWALVPCLVLAGGPIGLALIRTVPAAVRLGSRTDPPAEQIRLARGIGRDHRICALSMAAFLALWLATGLS